MDKEREISPHGFVSLREYVDVQFSAIKEAVSKAETASDRRFDGVNEFRAQLGDQTRLLMPRLEAEEKFKSMEKTINDLTTRVNAREDRGRGMGEIWGYIVGAVGAAALILSLVLRVMSK
jgi:hypothetical protein